MMDELNTALNNTKLGKSSGPDGIHVLPEILVFGGDYLKSSLLLLFNRFWDTEVIPGDLIDANITVFFKKGDHSLCNNYRGISLLSIVGKVFGDIILQRLHILAERIYAESQSGYRKGRSTIDGIFTSHHFYRAPVAQLIEHRSVTREVVSSTPVGPTLRVLKNN